MRKLLVVAGTVLLCCGVAFGAETARKGGKPVVKLETSLGVIQVELYPDKAPISVKNFLTYVKEGHYDGLIFHRVIRDFLIQGGGFRGDESIADRSTRRVKNEADRLKTPRHARVGGPRSSMPRRRHFFVTCDNDFLTPGRDPARVRATPFRKQRSYGRRRQIRAVPPGKAHFP